MFFHVLHKVLYPENNKMRFPWHRGNEKIDRIRDRDMLNSNPAISTSNHMFGRAIWDKLPKCIFENFEIARVKRGQFQKFWKLWGWFIPRIAPTNMWLLVNHTKPIKHFVLKLISFKIGQWQINEWAITK